MKYPFNGLSDRWKESVPWMVLVGWRGSISHGMFVPSNDPGSIDDKDVMGVCVPPVDTYMGLKSFGSRGTMEIKEGEMDIVTYELKKFVSLLAKGNPNVISLLWLDKTHYLHTTPEGDELIRQRRLFSNKSVYYSFTGYAHAQLHKMTHLAFKGYMGDKRKKLVEKFGYDTKNAAHLIRLLRMAIEFLGTGEFEVQRRDARELLEVKAGQWSLEAVKAEADRLRKLADEAFVRSKLPDGPDMERINCLLVSLIRSRLKE